MRIINNGDIWKNWAPWTALSSVVVVPTNEGWDSNGDNVMGAGVAKDCVRRMAQHDVNIKSLYGRSCHYGESFKFYPEERLLMFPTIKLNPDNPSMSWANGSSYDLIEKNAIYLNYIAERNPSVEFYMPLVGCGCGGLDPNIVEPLLIKRISANNVFLVYQD